MQLLGGKKKIHYERTHVFFYVYTLLYFYMGDEAHSCLYRVRFFFLKNLFVCIRILNGNSYSVHLGH